MKETPQNPWSIETATADDTRVISPIPLPILQIEGKDEGSTLAHSSEREYPLIPLRHNVLFTRQAYALAISEEDLKQWFGKRNNEHDISGSYAVFAGVAEDAAEELSEKDIYPVGVLCHIAKQISFMPNEETSDEEDSGIIVVTEQLVSLRSVYRRSGYLRTKVDLKPETLPRNKRDKEFSALIDTVKDLTLDLIGKMFDEMPEMMVDTLRKSNDPIHIVNFSASVLALRQSIKQELLQITAIKKRASALMSYLQEANEIQDLKNSIRSKTKVELDKKNREYILTQQLQQIRKELGDSDENGVEIKELEERAQTKKWSESVANSFAKELRKLKHMYPQSPDYATQYQYLETLLELPWGVYTNDEYDLKGAQAQLDKDHYGLEKIKERIIEHLAVLKLRNDMKSPILCLWGPPGVGKTSLGRSIAKALGRKYIRISLGGVNDEGEIRGHRRTYIGAMPGRIIQSIKKCGSSNPVIVLDEIDKIDRDYKGDPSNALLEVLDPEQNIAFHDNYIDIDFDLSKVLFIATANTLSTVSRPLLDRMELVQLTGYIDEEKQEIALRHLIPHQLEEHGLKPKDLKFSRPVLELLIDGYTRESGVRNLEKQIAAICRKRARTIADEKETKPRALTQKLVKELLGPPPFSRDSYEGNEYYGVVTGLAWTSVGGEILLIETSIHPGKEGNLILTGNLGNVMKESASIAFDYIRSHAEELGIQRNAFKDSEVHLHVPEGAVPKDGPSAGITMTTSLVSAFAKRRLRPRFAMTGEMTLRGKVLPVGGIKEKILAAKRAGIEHIILSKENEKDISQIDQKYLGGVSFHYVKDIREVLDIALEPKTKEEKES